MSPQPPEHQAPPAQGSGGEEILWAQVRLLYANAKVGVSVTLLVASILACLQWAVIPHAVVLGWWSYMALASIARRILTRRFEHATPTPTEIGRWRAAFAVGAGLVGAGWGAAGVLLFPEGYLTNQVFLIFVLGGMMLGAAVLLAARPEAFLAFLIPTGFAPAVHLVFHGDQTHVAMGILAAVFTLAILITTGRIYRTVELSLRLQFENRGLVDSLQAAKNQTEALNQVLELRVEERTAELKTTTEQLRAEITQREEVEEELLRARKLESLGVLAGGIAHDFNNVLTVIQGNLELVKADLEPEDPVHARLDEAVGASQRAAFLTAQLLTFAKGGAPIRRVVSVADLVMDAIRLVRTNSPISIDVNIAGDLWCAAIDPGQIGQVLYNMLLNAREAMPEGGIIEVRAENVELPHSPDVDRRVRISIRDYGCGIPSDVLPRVFDPYFTTKPGGRGLGLATAYAIVTKHGGNILVESTPGSGTVFTIDLPATQESPAPQRPPIAAPVQRGTEHLLVMDDEESLRILLKTVLTGFGYQVQTARDGAEAIALYEEAMAAGQGFDAVLLDLTVSGGMGGIETARKLKELDPSSKLIVSSGYSDAPVMSDFASYGFDAVIPKPWRPNDIGQVFRKVLLGSPERERD